MSPDRPEWMPGEHPRLPFGESAGAVRQLHQEIELAVRRWLGDGATVDATSPVSMFLSYPAGGHHFFSIAELMMETRSLSAESRRQHVRIFISGLPSDAAEARARTDLKNLSVVVASAGRLDALGSLGRGKVPILRAHPQLDVVLSLQLPEGGLTPMSRSSLRDGLGDISEHFLWTRAIENLRGDAMASLRRGDAVLHDEEMCGWWRPFVDGELGLSALLMCSDLICGALRGKVRPPWGVWLMTTGPLFFSAQPGADLDQKLRSGLSTVASDSELFVLPWPLNVGDDGVLGAGVRKAEAIMDEVWGGARLSTTEGLTFQTRF